MHDTPHNDPRIQETVKVAEIKDNFGMTRFKVALTDSDDFHGGSYHDDLRDWDCAYQVDVVSYCYGTEPLILVSKFFEDYRGAIAFFKQNVAIYSDLVKVETRHYQDIEIYKDKIGYKVADCCATCQWAKKNPDPHARRRFVCCNEDLFIPPKPEFEPEAPAGHPERVHDAYHKHHECRHTFQPVYPEVDTCGICSAFKKFNKNAEVK